jgi:hypothetical protein
MATWRFRSNGMWQWQRLDAHTEEVVAEAALGFHTLRECVENARRHGYSFGYEDVSDAMLLDSSIAPDRLRPPPCTRY